jgi:hypothetical protein
MPIKESDMPNLCLKWANGDKSAATFLMNVAAMTRLADDIADGDSEDQVADMAHLLHRSIVTNGTNTFFRTHTSELAPAMANAIMMWLKSEKWRKSTNRKTRMFAFIYREGVEHIVHVTALLTGGYEHALSVMDELHEASHVTNPETFEEWEKENGTV